MVFRRFAARRHSRAPSAVFRVGRVASSRARPLSFSEGPTDLAFEDPELVAEGENVDLVEQGADN